MVSKWWGNPISFWSTWYQSKSFWSHAEKKIFANSRPAANGPSSHTMSACSPSPWPAKCHDWLVERKKHIAFLQSHVPTEHPTMFLLPLQTWKSMKKYICHFQGLCEMLMFPLEPWLEWHRRGHPHALHLPSLAWRSPETSAEKFSSKILANHVELQTMILPLL